MKRNPETGQGPQRGGEYFMRKLPIGVQGFQGLRNDVYLYVDKTEYIYQLVRTGRQYFLSRPRRFGKSLLLSTMKCYWEGKKKLFQGLKIEELEAGNPEAWKPYPVFYFDFNRDNYKEEKKLEKILEVHLKEWEKRYGCEDPDALLTVRFQNLLVRAFQQTGLRCVVLVDEYDKPLLEGMGDSAREERDKAVYKGFFSTLKSFDEYLEFVFITGVTKFEKVSIFSDLNQLNDISLTEDYAGICGITESELLENFRPEIEATAAKRKMTPEECLQVLKKRYDGYRFYPDGVSVYNPLSLLKVFYGKDFGSYWFETGTPTFLVRKLKQERFDVRRLTDRTLYATEAMLFDYRADNPDPVPLLYQTGYLTIVDYDEKRRRYILGFPNEEVKYGTLESLMPEYVIGASSSRGTDIFTLESYIEEGNLEGIRNILTALFAEIPYTREGDPFENYFQSVIYLVFTLLGHYTHCEMHTFTGRVDCVLETDQYVYLFEFKRDDTVEAALRQIEEMQYALPYAADPRTLYRIGVTFDSEQRILNGWKVQE